MDTHRSLLSLVRQQFYRRLTTALVAALCIAGVEFGAAASTWTLLESALRRAGLTLWSG